MNSDHITAVIDADSLIYIVAPKYQVTHTVIEMFEDMEPDDKEATIQQMYEAMDKKVVTDHIDQFLNAILAATKAHYYLGFLGHRDGSNTFRHKMKTTKPYKGNRKSTPRYVKFWKPIIVEHLVTNWGFKELSNIEADDACIICATHIPNVTTCSPDKDLRQIEGTFYDYKKHEFDTVDKIGAIKNLYSQCLTGDSTDNIPGCPKVGDKSPFLQFPGCETIQDFHNFTFEVFKKKGFPEMMQEQLTLVFMLRHPDGVDLKEVPEPIPCPHVEEVTMEQVEEEFKVPEPIEVVSFTQ